MSKEYDKQLIEHMENLEQKRLDDAISYVSQASKYSYYGNMDESQTFDWMMNDAICYLTKDEASNLFENEALKKHYLEKFETLTLKEWESYKFLKEEDGILKQSFLYDFLDDIKGGEEKRFADLYVKEESEERLSSILKEMGVNVDFEITEYKGLKSGIDKLENAFENYKENIQKEERITDTPIKEKHLDKDEEYEKESVFSR